MKFLCEPHRHMMLQYPDIAQLRWEEWMNRGYQAMEVQAWQKAVMFYGCCFEISELFLKGIPETSGKQIICMLDQLMVSGYLLAESLGRGGNISMERHYLLAVHAHLTTAAEGPLLKPATHRLHKNLELSLIMLKRHYRQYGEFESISDCIDHCKSLLGRIESQQVLH